MNKEDGGPAFPQPLERDVDGCMIEPSQTGLTVRQYYAAKAMHAMVSTIQRPGAWHEDELATWSRYAFKIADTMIAVEKE